MTLSSTHALTVLVAALLLATGCASNSSPRTSEVERNYPDPGMTHVHGLGVDPADGTLYAATHRGLFVLVPGQAPRRIADRWQDTMGFTVVGPRTFLGSGHPDFDRDPTLPPRLGLIRSTDAGQSWQPVSLTGTADLHVLRVVRGTVWAWDGSSGTLLRSTDEGVTWARRATVPLDDFVVSPDGTTVVATRGGTLSLSADRGQTFTGLGGPGLRVLGWTEQGLVGLDAVGIVHVSPGPGRGFVRRGAVGGAPAAFTMTGGAWYAATEQGTILSSRDDGLTWQVLARDPGGRG